MASSIICLLSNASSSARLTEGSAGSARRHVLKLAMSSIAFCMAWSWSAGRVSATCAAKTSKIRSEGLNCTSFQDCWLRHHLRSFMVIFAGSGCFSKKRAVLSAASAAGPATASSESSMEEPSNFTWTASPFTAMSLALPASVCHSAEASACSNGSIHFSRPTGGMPLRRSMALASALPSIAVPRPTEPPRTTRATLRKLPSQAALMVRSNALFAC
mmetsp:Transcript_92937/g.165268  ORF Transcript_92937/g.165268 Transcript_92937/m.165268 type:complete len:216 (+) Transcript_92937:183-830(+)